MKRASDFRNSARACLRGRWPLAVIAGIVASLLGATGSDGPGIKLDIDATGAHLQLQFAGQTVYTAGGSLNSDIGTFLLGSASYITLIAVIMAVVYFILSSVIGVGYARFNLDLTGTAAPSLGSLFSCVPRWKTATLAKLLKSIYIFLWSLLLVIPGIVASYSYAMTRYLLAEYPRLSASEALSRSRQLMRGNRWRLFCLHLSFIGWDILCALTLGIGTVFIIPYKNAATAAFYRDVCRNDTSDFIYV